LLAAVVLLLSWLALFLWLERRDCHLCTHHRTPAAAMSDDEELRESSITADFTTFKLFFSLAPSSSSSCCILGGIRKVMGRLLRFDDVSSFRSIAAADVEREKRESEIYRIQ